MSNPTGINKKKRELQDNKLVCSFERDYEFIVELEDKYNTIYLKHTHSGSRNEPEEPVKLGRYSADWMFLDDYDSYLRFKRHRKQKGRPKNRLNERRKLLNALVKVRPRATRKFLKLQVKWLAQEVAKATGKERELRIYEEIKSNKREERKIKDVPSKEFEKQFEKVDY